MSKVCDFNCFASLSAIFMKVMCCGFLSGGSCVLTDCLGNGVFCILSSFLCVHYTATVYIHLNNDSVCVCVEYVM